jgi:hypothetical protein
MWKFFIKSFSLIIGLSLIFNLLGDMADRIAPLEDWRTEHQQRLENLQTKNEVIEAVTLGNSHSDSIDYSVLGIEGQSLAYAAMDLFEVEKYAAFVENELPNLEPSLSRSPITRSAGIMQPSNRFAPGGSGFIRWYHPGLQFKEIYTYSLWEK